MVPAHERFDPARPAIRERDLRLVVHDELPSLDAATQLCRERETIDAVLVVLAGVQAARRALGLRAVQGDVCVAQQLVGVAAVLRVARDADAAGDMEDHRVDLAGTL